MKIDAELIAELMPSLRAEIARELVNFYKVTQTDASKMIGMTQPAISQYVRQLRGKASFDSETRKEISALCSKLVNENIDKSALKNELYNICRSAVERRK
ncbi:hypothetical protein HYZ41_01260 [archaeon]|nr:hypothetical protein [archaeon]